ncbi:NACHT, LRR and PYD domains-containing protein 3-like [Sardina pilchardus]|uniref:NACHT, LRR and PYD domains-containing protein 3-like n=1 Tax=Sardina pilchardus TaxID=27697 RepID=UPI002E131D38
MSRCGDGEQGATASKRQHPENCAVETTGLKKKCLLEDDSMAACDQPDQNAENMLPMSELLLGVIQNHKATLKRKNGNLIETITVQEDQSPLSMLYTELLITVGDSEGVNEEHEVLQIELSPRKQISQDVKIHCNDIFRSLPMQESKYLRKEQHIKTVLTKGIAGIGKTISVLKFIVDWAEGYANEDVHFLIVFPFRALNLVKENQCSLQGLLQEFHPELKELDPMTYEQYKTVFIFDGLDESQLQLDFSKELYDVTTISSVDVLVTNLIKGNMFPSAKIWITSRPAATNQVPHEFISRVTEIQGFADPQKEEYFRRRVSDQDQANRIISHIKALKSLHIMCHIPVFCWIAAFVFQQIQAQDKCKEIPKTLTELYIHFLIIQTKIKNKKFQEDAENNSKNPLESNKEILLKLAELALNQLLRGNIIFYDEDLKECAIDVNDATVYSGICTEVFLKEEHVLHQKKVFCFVHRSVQEFFAALYVFYCYLNKNMKVLGYFLGEKYESEPEVVPLDVLLKKAVDKALDSDSGSLDLFIRFLHGISLEANQKLLHGVLPYTESKPESRKKTVKNLKLMQQNNVQPERWINILHCLTEMHDCSVHDDIKDFLQSKMYKSRFTLAHCTALVYMLLMSEEELDEFDLRKYNTSDEGRRRLLPAVRCCRKALFADCKLTEESCETLASALRSGDLPLRELDLSINDIQDSGVKLLSNELKNQQCKLQILRLAGCNLTDVSCSSVVSVLRSANSALRELDLSHNKLQDSALTLLSAGLEDPNCKLEVLRLVDCELTAQSCEAVASVLQSVNCPLKELDMSHNDLQDSGVKFLCVGLRDPVCHLQILRLSCCLVTVDGCASLASALHSNPTHLRELDLSYNHPTESGVKLLSAKREDSHHQIKLNVDKGGEFRLTPGPQKYVCKLSMDPNTANTHLCLSEANRKATWNAEKQPHPSHPERFKGYCYQVLCREGLSGRCYWEAEWDGNGAAIGVAYKGVNRRALSDQYWTGTKDKSWLGYNDKSWSLYCAHNTFSVRHNNQSDNIPAPSTFSRRVGVYLDWPAGTLSFYSVSPNTGSLTPLYTFHATFTEPLYPGFWLWESSVSLCH